MRVFRWLSPSDIPDACDLRLRGWALAGQDTPIDKITQCPILLLSGSLGENDCLTTDGLRSKPQLKQVLLLQVGTTGERASFLRRGFGDALGCEASLAEVESRALRLMENAAALPRLRDVGPLRLDFFARDGFVGRHALGLHPREFALIWRLAETPEIAVPKAELVADVWRMAFVPDTNSIAVHIFRLRTKLAIAGLDGLVQTALSGGYFLVPDRSSRVDQHSQQVRRYGQRHAAV